MGLKDADEFKRNANELARASAELSKLDDVIRGQIGQIEEALQLRITVQLRTRIDEDLVLAWAKYQDKGWRLLIESVDDSEAPVLLTHFSREVRMRVFVDGVLEALLRNGIGDVEQRRQDRHKAISEAEKIIESIRKAAT